MVTYDLTVVGGVRLGATEFHWKGFNCAINKCYSFHLGQLRVTGSQVIKMTTVNLKIAMVKVNI